MESPLSVQEAVSTERPASLAEAAQLVTAGEELLFRAKVIAQRIHERCHQMVESDLLPRAYHDGLADSH